MSYTCEYVDPTGPPSGGPRPGTVALGEAVLFLYPGVTNVGIYNPRDVCGNPWPHYRCGPSVHSKGAAIDFGVPNRARGDLLAHDLIGHHPDLGIAEVIWWERRWTKQLGWRPYHGRSPHKDHVHASQSADAAARLTRGEALMALRGASPDKPVAVAPRWDPPLRPIVDAVERPGGAVAVAADGSVYALGSARYVGGPFGQPYWQGRSAARIEPLGEAGYTVVATTGETYHYPAT